MSKAPEWIYLDGDVEAGDGMFPRCFENPKYASEPQVEYVRVDLAEAVEQQGYASAMEDARKLHEARIEELEAKLAKAVKALDGVMVGGNHLATILPNNFPQAETEPLIALETMGYGYDYEVWCCWRSIMLARTTLAELTGGKDE